MEVIKLAIEKIECMIGTQDIPVIQDQPKFVVDLLESNIIIYGAAMSGKTNFIKLLITILHKKYREDTEQIFILDFGGALADFGSLPLVGAYFDNANEEYVKRVFKLMEDQLKDNIKKLKGKNYRDVKEDQPIHTTLFIDNVNAFLDEPRYGAYQEKLAKLCRDGLSKGITIVATASSTKGTASLINNFKQKIALELPPDSYMDIFSHKVIPVGNNPGHGFANVTVNTADNAATYPMQLAYELQLNIADDIDDESFKANVKKYFGGRTVKKYLRFPDVLTLELYDGFVRETGEKFEATPHSVSVGLDYTDCKPIKADFSSTKCVAIYGKKGFGKTNLLKILLKGFIEDPMYNFVLFDDGRGELEKISEKIVPSRKKYISLHQEEIINFKEKIGSTALKEVNTKLSPMQLFIKNIHENFMDLSQVRRLTSPVLTEIFGTGAVLPSKAAVAEKKNVVFVLQSKFLYVNSIASKCFMEVILPSMVARADEMNWIFIFSDVKPISESETRENFHTTIGTAFLLDSIAEFVSERGGKSVFGGMDVKTLKEEYAPCEEGDGYYYSIEKDDLKKLKFIKDKEE